MSEKSLYSEVKARKLAGAKKNIVQAVEKHGKILGIKGKYEKPDKVIKFCYASVKDVIRPSDVPKTNLSKYDMVLVGCPGSEIPKIGISKFREYVIEEGGWLYTTDWCLRTVVENAFPGYMHWDGTKTGDVVVPCRMTDAHHPFLDGVYSAIMTGKYGSNSSKSKGPKGPKGYGKSPTFSWWLEDKSFPISIDRPDAVHVLIRSEEIGRKWGNDPVLCYFDVGKRGGRVIHQISHSHLQKGGGKGKFVSAMILTNILDEKVGLKHGIKKGSGGPNYQDYGGSQQQSAIDWGDTTQTSSNDYVTPSSAPTGNSAAGGGMTPELTGTAQVVEVTNKKSIPNEQKCALGDGTFQEFEGRVFKCSGCGTLYHEQCLNVQLQNGICKICERIFLY